MLCFAMYGCDLTGFYCEEGTVDPEACPPGTFGSTVGLRNVTECTLCSPGYYCQTPGLTASEGEQMFAFQVSALQILKTADK